MAESQTISVAIPCDWQTLYEHIWRPEFFPQWASGLSSADLHAEGSGWVARGPAGKVRIRFTGHNEFGIMDHWVESADAEVVYVPLRVLADCEGALVQLTLFRQPGMTDAQFARDAEWVRRDLDALRDLACGF